MRTCRKGHQYRGDENYRARRGWCPVCFRETQARYNKTENGRTRHNRYEHSEKGEARRQRYRQSPAGWLSALNDRRNKAVRRRRNRTEAEDS